jgi:hypothetical protein
LKVDGFLFERDGRVQKAVKWGMWTVREVKVGGRKGTKLVDVRV